MTWNAQFEVTSVEGGTVKAEATVKPESTDYQEAGVLRQNTERAVRMRLEIDFEDGVKPNLQVGDALPAQGHFSA